MDFLTEILKTDDFKKSDKIKDFRVTTYNDLEHDDLINLYKTAFPDLKSERIPIWKNKKNPFAIGDPFTFLMRDKNKLIAQYTVTPMHFYIYGKKVLGVQSGGTMTHKDYRCLGISSFLAKLSYEYSKRDGYLFIFGFPNPNSIHLIEKKMKWTIFGKCEIFTKQISANIDLQKNNDHYRIKEIEIFDENINFFWDEVKNYIPFTIKKDMDYLNWRFVAHPWAKYKFFLIIDTDSDKIVSYFVLKKYKNKQSKLEGHIIDFLINPRNKNIEKELFKLIESNSICEFKDDCSLISCWLPNSLKEIALNELGYSINKMETFVGYKILSYRKELDILYDFSNWYFTMAISDVF